MSVGDRELVRQALIAALDQLDRDGSKSIATSGVAPAESSRRANAQTPVVVVYVGGAEVRNQAPSISSAQITKSSVSSDHPCHGRFSFLELPTFSSAPKTCFMEPDRVCVNSGACEVLGY